MTVCRIFDTKDCVDEIVDFLENEDVVELVRNDEVDFLGETEHIVEGKIKKGKRAKFSLHYGAFLIVGKTLCYSYGMLNIDDQTIFLNHMELKELDNVSISIEY